MRAKRALIAAAVLAASLMPAMADDRASAVQCDVPNYLLTTESILTRTAAAVKERRALNVLVAGTRSSVLPGNDGEAAAYPARLQAVLGDRLPGVTVTVTTSIQPKKTAEEVAAEFKTLAEERKPDLVIWQTGTVDAIRSTDPEDFRSALDDGIAGLRTAGLDVMLVNLQYSPRTDTVMTVTPYIDNMRVVAQRADIPLFDRFSIMRDWQDSGDFDLFGAPQASALGMELAKRVHTCLGRAMATFVIEAARINPAELRIQR